jgi:hypothetical protein
MENDALFNTDRYYTNGISLAWMVRESPVPDALWERGMRVFNFGRQEVVRASSGVELAQMMATPRDITIAEPQPDDRPWAGLLYFAPSYHLQSETHLHALKVQLGVVGEWSFADETQDYVHRLRKIKRPRGWRHQIPNEVVFGFAYEERWKFATGSPGDPWRAEIIPSMGIKGGTIEVSGRGGFEARVGFRIPRDFGSTLIGTAGNIPGDWGRRGAVLSTIGSHLFVGGHGAAVLHQVMLDGALFHDSPSIGRETWVGTVTAGISITSSRFRVTYQEVATSREFKGQAGSQRFSSLSIALSW